MKKITSMFLALVMALSLTVPAFASSGTVKVEGSIQIPTVNVVLPTTASMVMNPYNMDVKLNPKDTNTVNDQIISPVMEVKNLSNIGIQVGIKVTGTTGKGEAAFKNATTASSTTKEAYIYVAFEIGDTGMSVTDTNGAASNAVVLSTTEAEVTDFASTAAAGNANTLAASTDLKNPATNGVLGFKFFGDVAPVTTWTDKDTLAATIAFTFTPVAVNTTPTPPSAGDASVTVSISGTTATATFNAGTSGLSAASYAWSSGTTSTATVSGTSNTATITQDGGASNGDTSVITVVVTLDNGATVTGSATYTAT